MSEGEYPKTTEMERCDQKCPGCGVRCMTLIKGTHVHWHFVGDSTTAHQWRLTPTNT